MRHAPLLLLLVACSGKGEDSDPTGPVTGTAATGTAATGTPTGDTPTTGGPTTGTPTGTPTGTGTTAPDPWDCAPWPIPAGNQVVIPAGDVTALRSAVDTASPGDVILLEDGTWDLNGDYLWIDTADLTLMGQSQDASLVVLDGGGITTEILTVAASGVTVAHLTVANAYTHGVHATGGDGFDVTGTVLYDVDVLDPGEQAIKVNQTGQGTWTDDGLIACSRLELTDAGRPLVRNNCYTGGVDMHASRGWTIRDNHIEGFWCDSGLSEHGIHLWRKNAESHIERNRVVDCARGIGLGLSESPGAFDRDHGIDCGPAYVDDIRGTIVNNTVFASDPDLFASGSGYDAGITVWNACEAVVAHNTVFSTSAPYSAIEWRFPATSATIVNNLSSHIQRERTPGIAVTAGNLETAEAGWFVNAGAGDLHLAPGTPAADQGDPSGPTHAPSDLDGQPRTSPPDVGADES